MIKSKMYYYIRMELLSPMSIGNGDDFLTKHDCIRNSQGKPFIPGTTLAGVFSHYLSEKKKEIFTPKLSGDYKQSPFFISDANVYLENKQDFISTNIRDGVKLDENKTTVKSAKFDFEVVETGTKFDFRIEVVLRDNDDSSKIKNVVDVILNGLDKGEILLGYKSKRGYGKVKLLEVRIKEFEK